MKIAAILTVLLVAGSRLPAQGPAPLGVQQRSAAAALPKLNDATAAVARVAERQTKHGAVLGGMAGLMTGLVFVTVSGPVGDAADTPGGAIKVVALSVVAGVVLGALIGSLIH